jgi:alkylation response protein AidB-like acyl-CoA dehydrogenase
MAVFTEEQLELKKTARRVARERVAPVSGQIEKSGEHPGHLVDLFRSLGWLSLTTPTEYGGVGGGTTEWCIVQEELAQVSSVAAHLLGHNSVNTLLSLMGSQEQKMRFFPILEERYSCFMASEPDAGSDVSSIRTTAVEKDGHYVINGRKQWVGHGGYADFYIVVATVDPGAGARGLAIFLVDGHESSGIIVEREEDLMGMRGASVAEITLESVEVPAANRIDGGNGIRDFVEFMVTARPTSAAQAVGLSQAAMEYALRYTHERRQFGRPVYEFQAVSHMIAEMATQIEAARELTYWAAGEVDRHGPRRGEIVSMAKAFATDVAMRVTTDAVQCMGASGYSKEHPVERMMRDAKILQIYEGTNQIQRESIAKLLSRRLVAR